MASSANQHRRAAKTSAARQQRIGSGMAYRNGPAASGKSGSVANHQNKSVAMA